RGMGMDIVHRVVVGRLGGELHLHTSPGEGSTFVLRIPLTITIVDALGFACADQSFVVPLATIEEVLDVGDLRPIRGPSRAGAPAPVVFERRGEVVVLLRLDDVLGLPGALAGEGAGKALVVRRGGRPYAFRVDRM